MLIIGSHVSFNKDSQLLGSVNEALSYEANTFMFYTGAPQNTNRTSINDDLVKEAFIKMKKNNIDVNNVIVHAPYIVNLANDEKKENYDFAISFLIQEIKRCKLLGISKIVLHPGSYVNVGKEKGLHNIINGLNIILNNTDKVNILLETMSLKGSEIGSIDDIKYIIDKTNNSDRLGVCLDTCHLFDSGYNVGKFEELLDLIEEKIGISKIGCVHINDSKNTIGSKKDRHDNLGYGEIGFDNLLTIIYNKRLENVPKILETPYVSISNDSKERVYPPYKFEIIMIKKKEFNPNLILNIRDYYGGNHE